MDNDIGLKGLKRPRLYRRTTTCCKTKILLWKNCFQDIRHGFFGGLDLSVEKFFMAVFYNFPHRLKGLRKTKKRRNCTRKITLRRLPIWSLLGAVHITYYRIGRRGGGSGHSCLLQYYPAVNDVKS